MATAKKKSTKPVGKAKRPVKKAAKPINEETDLIRRVTAGKMQGRKTLPEFSTGDTIGVYVRVKEGEKERVQLYRGVVTKMQGTGFNRTFTVRKISAGVGVERTFPLASMGIDRVEVIATGKVRRGRLFYLRGLKGRSARLDSELYQGE
jgi:large subunit ribosomal protein L19